MPRLLTGINPAIVGLIGSGVISALHEKSNTVIKQNVGLYQPAVVRVSKRNTILHCQLIIYNNKSLQYSIHTVNSHQMRIYPIYRVPL